MLELLDDLVTALQPGVEPEVGSKRAAHVDVLTPFLVFFQAQRVADDDRLRLSSGKRHVESLERLIGWFSKQDARPVPVMHRLTKRWCSDILANHDIPY